MSNIQINDLRSLSAQMLAREIDLTSQTTSTRGDGVLTQEELTQYGRQHGYNQNQIDNSWIGLQRNSKTFLRGNSANLENLGRGFITGFLTRRLDLFTNLFTMSKEVERVGPNLGGLGILYTPISAVVNSALEYFSAGQIPMISIQKHVASVFLNTIQDTAVALLSAKLRQITIPREPVYSLMGFGISNLSLPNPLKLGWNFGSKWRNLNVIANPIAGYFTRNLLDIGLRWIYRTGQ